MADTYLIEYSCNGKTKKTRVKNCMSELHAKVKLGSFLKSNGVNDFEITSCDKDVLSELSGLFGGVFNDIFKKK